MTKDRAGMSEWAAFSRALARLSQGGHVWGPPQDEREDEEMLACLGAATLLNWSRLSRDVQRDVFETALAASNDPAQDTFRQHLARVLHSHHDRTAQG